MGTKKRTEITLKAKQTLVIRSFRSRAAAWCAVCGAAMVTPEQAAVLSETSARAVYRLIEGGRLHFIETGDGRLLICLDSLQAVL